MNNYEVNPNQIWTDNHSFTTDSYLKISKDFNCVLDVGSNTSRGGILKNIFPNLKLFGVDLLKERIDKISTVNYK